MLERVLEHLVLTGDDPSDLEERLLELFADLAGFTSSPLVAWSTRIVEVPVFWMRSGPIACVR